MKDMTLNLFIPHTVNADRKLRWTLALGALLTLLLGANRVAAQGGYPQAGGSASDYQSPMSTDQVFDSEPGYGWDPGGPAYLPGCPPTWHARGEIMMWNREGNSGFSLSNGFRLNDFQYTEGIRVTVGRKYDCTMGWEASYMGLFEWEESGQATGAGTLNTTLIPNGVNLSAFNGANLHQQLFRSELQSIEFNQKWWGWDVLSTSVGARYINVEGDFNFRSVGPTGDVGLLAIESNNNLVGAQLGLDLYYPVGRFSADVNMKGGLFANFDDVNVGLANAGTVQIANSTDDVEFAAMIQMGAYFRYNLTRALSVRAGYEFLWVYGLAIDVDQISRVIGPDAGTSPDGQGSIFYHGGSAGVELVF